MVGVGVSAIPSSSRGLRQAVACGWRSCD